MVNVRFDELIQQAKVIKNKVTAAIHLSNQYVGAYRTNPLQRIKFLVSCIDQIDQLLLTLEQAHHTVKEEYQNEAIALLGEVVEAHDHLANEAVRECLEPIPSYIQKSMDAAHSNPEQCKMEIFESSLSKNIILIS